jgi:CRISPR-associated protein Cas2
MQQTYVVCYDVGCPKRWRSVYKTMRGYGDAVQYSVFRCELSKREMVELREKLRAIIHHTEDRVLFVDVGPAATRGKAALWAMGRTYLAPDVTAVVI